MPVLLPNQQCQNTEDKKYHIPRNCSPKLLWGSSHFVMTTFILSTLATTGMVNSYNIAIFASCIVRINTTVAQLITAQV